MSRIAKQIGAKVLGKTQIGEPGEGCTETFITIGVFDNREKAENCQKYLATKFCRAMLSTKKSYSAQRKRHLGKCSDARFFRELRHRLVAVRRRY